MAGAVMATLLMLVATATPMLGVVSVIPASVSAELVRFSATPVVPM